KRMLEVLDTEPAIRDEVDMDERVRLKTDTTHQSHVPDSTYVVSGLSRTLQGEIEFRDLTFRYGDTPVLEHVSARIEAGQSVALVGPTGSGKSTLISLLARLH